jgi:hypothetical protein
VTDNVLKPHYETLLLDFLLPIICLTKKDMELWKEEPGEYIRRQEDITVIISNN